MHRLFDSNPFDLDGPQDLVNLEFLDRLTDDRCQCRCDCPREHEPFESDCGACQRGDHWDEAPKR